MSRLLRRSVGHLLLAGFAGPSLPPEIRSLAREFGLGGVVLFKRNVEEPEQVAELAYLARTLLPDTPLWVGVDQEGGRVARLRAPFTEWPAMATLGRAEPEEGLALARRFARALGAELSAVGLTLDFAPVLDVHTNPRNPVIGDRALAGDPAPRMHRARRDGTGLACLYEHGNEEFVVHETFLGRTGDIVYTVWPYALWRMDWRTRERSKILDFNAWHITPDRAGALVLCDTNHPDRGLHLIDVARGEARFLCHSRASGQGSQWRTPRYALAEDFARARSEAGGAALSWMEAAADTVYGPQWTHPHPSFSRCERWVFFTSDRTGYPQVYAFRRSDG